MANNIELDYEDMPKFVPADHIYPSIDEIGKFVQRMKSVGALTPAALTALYIQLGWDVEGIEDLVFDDGDSSRGGDGMKSAGEGTADDVSGGDKSTANVENGGN